MKLNTIVDNAVESFAERIVKLANSKNSNVECFVEYQHGVTKIDKSEHARSALIKSEFGMVQIHPDFKTNSAGAFIYLIGKIKNLMAEGFEVEDIIKNEVTMSSVIPYDDNGVQILGHYLSYNMKLAEQLISAKND